MRPLLAALLVVLSVTGADAQSALVAPTLEAVVTPPFFGSETNRHFGSAVAMDGDHAATRGEIIFNEDGDGTVHMLRYRQGAWRVSQQIVLENGPAVRFGITLALEGDLLFVGAPGPDGYYAVELGSVYVYEFNESEWVLSDVIRSPVPFEPNRFSGFGVALDFDGERLIVGDPYRTYAGAAHIYERVGGKWTLMGSLTSPLSDSYAFARQVAIEGPHAVVLGEGGGTGQVYTFNLDGGTWTSTGDLASEVGLGGQMTLSMDGDRLLVGSPTVTANNQLGAVYVFEYGDGSWTRTAVLTDVREPGENGINFFGEAVDLDGDRLVAGSPAVGERALIFSFNGSGWEREASLAILDATPGTYFGTAVGLDNGRVLVGAPGTTIDGAVRVGTVEAFVAGAGGWTSASTVTLGPPRTGVRFGADVAMSGGRIAVGAPADGPVSELPGTWGSAYVFTVVGDEAVLEARVTEGYGPRFGTAVALGTDQLLVGSPGNDGYGRAFVYKRVGVDWVLSQTLYKPGAFGTSISLDGDRVLVGAPGTGAQSGQAYLYERADSAWQLVTTLQPGIPQNGRSFGTAVALDGPRAVVSAPYTASSQPGSFGLTYVFESDGNEWTPVATLSTGGPDQVFGTAVALDGGRALVGALSASGGGADGNGAFVFEGLNWEQTASLASPGPGSTFGSDVALDGGRALVGASLDGASRGQAFLYGYTGSGWTQTAALQSPAPIDGEAFGASGTVDGRRFAVGAPYPVVDAAVFGKVYVYRDQVTVAGEALPLISTTRLHAPRPNPVSGTSRLILSLGQPERIAATVYDALGRSVQTLLNGESVAGEVLLLVDARTLAPGLYVVRVVGETFAESRTLVVAR